MSLTTYGTQIDLRDIPARDRVALLFNTYRLLQSGQSMELVSDEDPAPLQTEFRLRQPAGFSWAPTENGPAAWRVRVVRLNHREREVPCGGGCACV